MAFDFQQTLSVMLGAAQGVVSEEWPQVQAYVKQATRSYLRDMEELAQGVTDGEIDARSAQFLANLHKRSMKMVMTAAAGMSLAMAEMAINAALNAAQESIGELFDFPLALV